MLRHSKDNRTPSRKPAPLRSAQRSKSVKPEPPVPQPKRASARPAPAPVHSMPAPPALLPTRSSMLAPPKPRTVAPSAVAPLPASPRPAVAALPATPALPAAAPPPKPFAEVAKALAEGPRPLLEAPKNKVVVTATPKTSLLPNDASGVERETLLGLHGKSTAPEPVTADAAPLVSEAPPELPQPALDKRFALPPAPTPPVLLAASSPPRDPTPEMAKPGPGEWASQQRLHVNVAEASPAVGAEGADEPVDEPTREKMSPLRPRPAESSRRHPAMWFGAGCLTTLVVVLLVKAFSSDPGTAEAAPTKGDVKAEQDRPAVETAANLPAANLPAASPPQVSGATNEEPEERTEAPAEPAPTGAAATEAKPPETEEAPPPKVTSKVGSRPRAAKGGTKRKRNFIPPGL